MPSQSPARIDMIDEVLRRDLKETKQAAQTWQLLLITKGGRTVTLTFEGIVVSRIEHNESLDKDDLRELGKMLMDLK